LRYTSIPNFADELGERKQIAGAEWGPPAAGLYHRIGPLDRRPGHGQRTQHPGIVVKPDSTFPPGTPIFNQAEPAFEEWMKRMRHNEELQRRRFAGRS